MVKTWVNGYGYGRRGPLAESCCMHECSSGTSRWALYQSGRRDEQAVYVYKSVQTRVQCESAEGAVARARALGTVGALPCAASARRCVKPWHTFGQCSAAAVISVRTMPALMLNRSSRVMPGLRGTPAGMITRSQPLRASASSASPV